MDYFCRSLALHKHFKGKLSIESPIKIVSKDDLSVAYTPGVAEPCRLIAKNIDLAYEYTIKGRTIAVVSDGSAVLGLGNIGPEAALPVMEGKCLLFKQFGGIDAFPICLNTQNPEEIIRTIEAIAPTFGGINLEDIAAPQCFYIEEELKKKLNIPVFHDDQHGTAIVVLAGLINSLKIIEKKFDDCRCVVAGAGAAGLSTTLLLSKYGLKDIIVIDRGGIIEPGRTDLNDAKKQILEITNPRKLRGGLADAVKGADVFVGVSAPNILNAEMVKSMNSKSVVFALSNPNPEIDPEIAKSAGAFILATGRSDYPNQINNVLAFPGIFKGALRKRNLVLDADCFIRAAEALASAASPPHTQQIIPNVFTTDLAEKVAMAICDDLPH